jgi:hypothetical protein
MYRLLEGATMCDVRFTVRGMELVTMFGRIRVIFVRDYMNPRQSTLGAEFPRKVVDYC